MNTVLDIALEIAIVAHRKQKDKGGHPYILHPLRLMHQMDTIEEKIVAVLHDVIEDSSMDCRQLSICGIPEKLVDEVNLLTKYGRRYGEYIERISTSELATKVKLADLEDNMKIIRIDSLSDKDFSRLTKYHQAWKYLTNTPLIDG